MSNPFAEEPNPWWRRFTDKDRKRHAPKPATWTAGFLGGLVGWTLPSHHSLVVGALAALAAAAPAAFVESWYRRRDRREDEQLFVLPEASPVTTKIKARGR